jgi:GNAT superfamily N-acetyltransferase
VFVESVLTLRHIEPADYRPIIAVVDEWWGGRNMACMLPRLFFTHFRPTSFVAEREERVGFLLGMLSQTFADQAYVHFVGVHPDFRGQGVAVALYEQFFSVARQAGRDTIKLVTSTENTASIAFHLHMGFEAQAGDAEIDGVPYRRDYDGPGEDRVVFAKWI